MLFNYRVLDLANDKGMFCAKLLADLGADVIKIERPGGDPARNTAPFLNNVPDPERSLYFWHYNTSKRGITLNIEAKRGRELFKRLIKTADIIIETYSPDYLDNLELSYNALAEVNPRLIVASITGFGRDGPYKNYKTCDLVASALGGQMYVCGDRDTPPLKPFGNQTYHMACLYATFGILLALRQRHNSGRGQHIDVSIHECVAATLDHVLVRYFYEWVVAKRRGNLHWSNGFRVFRCRDGYILLPLLQQWETLVEWLDSEGMAADLKEPRWRDKAVRHQGIDHIIQVLEQWTQVHTVSELVELGQLMHFPCAEVASPQQVVDNLQLKERGFFVEVKHPELKSQYQYPGAPYCFGQSPWQISRRAPLIGEHNKEIYGEELGLSESELSALVRDGVI